MSPRLGSSQPSEEPISDINMTPLVDVMLVLLILFMLVVPAATQQLAVRLPSVGGSPATAPSVARLTLLVDGSLQWNDQALAADELQPTLQAAARANPAVRLSLQADAQVPYQRVAQALAIARRSGVLDVQLWVQALPQ